MQLDASSSVEEVAAIVSDALTTSIRRSPRFAASLSSRRFFADIERDMARQRTELAVRPKDAALDLNPAI